jgi:hypothetical protein
VTEQEWLGSTDPDWMLEAILPRAGQRKVQLFRCAGIRRLWHHLTVGERAAIDYWEVLADTLTDPADLIDS